MQKDWLKQGLFSALGTIYCDYYNFSGLSKSSKKTLFRSIFLLRRQNFQKPDQKIFTQKITYCTTTTLKYSFSELEIQMRGRGRRLVDGKEFCTRYTIYEKTVIRYKII